jgi:hypothetical protein
MSISVVQNLAASEGTNSTSLQSSAFGSPTTSGNTIVVCVTGVNSTSSTTLSLSDTAGNSYTCALCNGYASGATDILSNPASSNIPSGTAFVSIWYAQNITGGSSFKITATWGASGASSALDISAAEISGIGASVTIDVTQAGNGVASAGNPATGSFSTSNANDIILAAMTGTSSAGASISQPSGFTQIGQGIPIGTGKRDISFGYEIVSSTQSGINPTFTTSTVNSATAIAVAFEAVTLAAAIYSESGVTGGSVQTSGLVGLTPGFIVGHATIGSRNFW